MKYKIVIFITIMMTMIISTSFAQTMIPFPKGWHPVKKSDYSTDDLAFLKNRIPNHLDADFNGDGHKDSAWILLKNNNKAWGLFVFLKTDNSNFEVIKLDESKKETEKIFMGISMLSPGKHKTACGKGYSRCASGDIEVLDLKYPGIDYFMFESANSVFYWDNKASRFKRVWLSD